MQKRAWVNKVCQSIQKFENLVFLKYKKNIEYNFKKINKTGVGSPNSIFNFLS